MLYIIIWLIYESINIWKMMLNQSSPRYLTYSGLNKKADILQTHACTHTHTHTRTLQHIPQSCIYPSQITRFMGLTWRPPGSCRPQMGPMLAPWTLPSGIIWIKTPSHLAVLKPTPGGPLMLTVWPNNLCNVPINWLPNIPPNYLMTWH